MLEVEWKFEADDDLVIPDLGRLEGVVEVRGPTELDLVATYFDSVDQRLSAFGVTVRRRTGGADEGWHLKVPSADDPTTRHEVQVPLSRSRRSVPKRIRDVLPGLLGGEVLHPVATVRTRRAVWRMLDADGCVLAELADDRVSASANGDRHDDGGAGDIASWREIEVELVDGEPSLLDDAAGLLGAAGAAPAAGPAPKVARVLGKHGNHEPLLPHGSDDRVALLVQARLREQLRELRARDPLAREDLPGGVHKMRVAVRRLRTGLATFRPYLERAITEPLREELSWLADVLGQARDAEVLRHRICELVDDLAPDTTVQRDLVGPLDEIHALAHARLVASLGSNQYLTLLRRLDALIVDPPWTPKAELTIDATYRKRIAHELRRLDKRMARAAASSLPEDRNTDLHNSRKAAKRLRYAVEPLVPVYGKKATRFAQQVEKLQGELGDHHDTVVARAYLRSTVDPVDSRPPVEPSLAFAAGVLHQREEQLAKKLEKQVVKRWKQVKRSGSFGR